MSFSDPRIFVTRPVPASALRALEALGHVVVSPQDAPISRVALLAGVAEANALVSMLTDRIDAEVLAAAPRLKVVANYAVGTNNLDLPALTQRGVVACNTPGVLTAATAELAMAMILDLLRGVSSGDRLMRREGFPGWGPLYRLGRGLAGKRLGLVGFGRIGQELGRLARAFGMELAYTQRRPLDPGSEARLEALYLPLEELLAVSDVVSLHCPLTPETRHLLDARRLAFIRPSAYLVNTARGEVVDEAALALALQAGRLAGAALDVYEREPAVDPRLLALDSTLLLPHLGSSTWETREAMGALVAQNLAAVLAGKPAHTPVN